MHPIFTTPEIRENIFFYLDPPSLEQTSSVCFSWHKFILNYNFLHRYETKCSTTDNYAFKQLFTKYLFYLIPEDTFYFYGEKKSRESIHKELKTSSNHDVLKAAKQIADMSLEHLSRKEQTGHHLYFNFENRKMAYGIVKV